MANRFTIPSCAVHGLSQPCEDCIRQNNIGRMPHDEKPLTRRDAAISAIIKERDFQDRKYGPVLRRIAEGARDGSEPEYHVQGPGGHELGAWLIVLEKELDEAKDALVHGGSKEVKGRNTIRAELVQIAAVALAALEQHGVEEGPIATLFYRDGMPE